jgi:peptide subunit release factor 1 (eRF1)
MITADALRELAGKSATERAFLSVYLAGPASIQTLAKQLVRLRRSLSAEGPERSEREHFDRNVELLNRHLDRKPLTSGSLAVFACWALDYCEAFPLTAPVADHICIDSSPFIRPLAEFLDEYENVAVVVADNKRARIFLVSAAVPGPAETVRGNVKNHVRKGGWSQQRYERRRDKQILGYSREIVEALSKLACESTFRRVLLVGGKEILAAIHDNLPTDLAGMVSDPRALDLSRGEGAIQSDLEQLFAEEERLSEQRLWEKIRGEHLRGSLGAVGLHDVLAAAAGGRVEMLLVARSFQPEGTRCRDCDHLHLDVKEHCVHCRSKSVYTVGVVNELCEQLALTGAEVDFADPLPGLDEAGHIAALLRY